jgi:HSP20 family protein
LENIITAHRARFSEIPRKLFFQRLRDFFFCSQLQLLRFILNRNPTNIMALFHRDPFLDGFFGETAPPSWVYHHPHSGVPAHHLYETETSVQLTVDVPGIKAKDLAVKVEDNVLQISGERKTSGRESKFVRSFAIDPSTVNVSLVKANLDCGVLTLTVPKKTKLVASKSIAVTETAASESQPDTMTA